MDKKNELLSELKRIKVLKEEVLRSLPESSIEFGNVQREIWKLDEVIFLIECGSQDEEFR